MGVMGWCVNFVIACDLRRLRKRLFLVLPAKTRLRISLAITAFAAAGIWASDQLEKAIPAPKDAAQTSKSPHLSPNSP